MTDREELIGQAVRVIHDGTCGGGCDTWADFVHPAKSLVDAGWRPPVSGDVVERAARTVQAAVADRQFAFTTEFYDAGHGGDYPPTRYTWDRLSDFEQDAWREGARALADAGLLVSPHDESWAALMRLLDKHWPEDIFPTKVPRSDTGRDPGPTIVSLLRWIDRLQATPVPGEFVDIPAQEFVSIPIPPDTETVELVAVAMAEAVYCDGTWLRLAAEKKADYRRYARAAPPRPHGGEHRWRHPLTDSSPTPSGDTRRP